MLRRKKSRIAALFHLSYINAGSLFLKREPGTFKEDNIYNTLTIMK